MIVVFFVFTCCIAASVSMPKHRDYKVTTAASSYRASTAAAWTAEAEGPRERIVGLPPAGTTGFVFTFRDIMRAFVTTTCLFLFCASDDTIPLDVLIVGAGQAGIAAAYRLSSMGYSLRVLEATDHVGGRTRNVDVRIGEFDSDSDDVIEVGGTWFSPSHSAALTLCKELGLEVFNASFAGAKASTSNARC